MYTPRYKEKYTKEVLPALKEQFGFKSVMRIPKITKAQNRLFMTSTLLH